MTFNIDVAWPTAIASKLAPTGIFGGLVVGARRKKSTYIQFFPPPHRHYQMKSRRNDAGSFSFVQVSP
jgi:hypothetical protein